MTNFLAHMHMKSIFKPITTDIFSKIALSGVASAAIFPCCTNQAVQKPVEKQNPNIIIIFTDDMGYGDLGCYGSLIHQTPNIDKMAENGIRFTDFYASAPVSTPSRASLLTGCYPQRIDMHVNEKPEDQFRAVLTPKSPKGLNPDEITIAEIVKEKGYKTACIGKWHLGDQKPFFPINHGFDFFYGILHSHNQGSEECPLAIFKQDSVVEKPVDIPLLTKKMTQQSIQFIKQNKDSTFFLYLPHPMPHFPLAASDQFKGKSKDGIYGDAIEEIDWSVGEIIKTLRDLGIENNTLLVFTSDNGGEARGGWVKGGLNHPLRGHKGQTWEGGMRIPCIIQWPAKIEAGNVCSSLTTIMDFLPTIAGITGTELPGSRVIDGKNILPVLENPDTAKPPYEAFYYYDRDQLQAIRWKQWKLHLPQEDGRYPAAWKNETKPFDGPQLYNLDKDYTETWNVASENPEVVDSIMNFAQKIRDELGDRHHPGKAIRKAGFVDSVQCPTN